MIVADASTWIDHWKLADLNFVRLLMAKQVMMHPFVLGELALGSLKDRQRTIANLRDLMAIRPASHDEVLYLIETRRLFSRGIGYVDAHLLASCLIAGNCKLLTHDRRLREAAEQLGIAA